ncbi:hypothetical protein [Chitinophaga niabensis]|uniref:Chaperone of endosialidase n=1 Tax=Chitinophaga niabensis TaxID=536979 RepID=A0A1N6F4J4_9BACT|nr:hypothetical protein [Chitinophaga niabensis]SIN90218.1 hypothetical protein SAMN04488055_2013 [Chitinophaga niabensis]
MKLYLALGICLITGTASAQIANSTTLQANANFNIDGTGKANHFRTNQVTSSGGNAHFMMENAGNPRWGLGVSTEETGVGSVGSNFAIFAYGPNYLGEYLTINRTTGYMGIAHRTPSHSLHIGIAAISGNGMRFGVPHDAGNYNVPVGAVTGGYNIDFSTWRDIVGDQIGARIRAERINNYYANNALIQATDLVLYTSDGSIQDSLLERMRINYKGNVGIGTAKPQYKLAVEGTIGARKVKVTQESWADFVFDATYKLPSVYETEQHILQYKRLPGIPSEAEVKENGVDVGEMNKLLLQKVEEQMLYIIELRKEVDALKKAGGKSMGPAEK